MDKHDLSFKDLKHKIETDLGKTEWITVYSYSEADYIGGHHCFFSALISNNIIDSSLKDPTWDLHIGEGRPSICTFYRDGTKVTEYVRYPDEGIEPFVHRRCFPGKEDLVIELSEEFRLFNDLYETTADGDERKLIHYNDNGDEELVAVIKPYEVRVKLRILKHYISVKNMNLVIFFDCDRYSKEKLKDLDLETIDETISGDNYIYRIIVKDDIDLFSEMKSLGYLLGKKAIRPNPDYKPDMYNERDEREYEEFIIGTDEDGRDLHLSCNPDSKGFLRTVYFKREVLNKYLDNPDKYVVEDGRIYCHGFWTLPIDNNHPDYVMVFIKDLGYLHINEQKYWRSFNIPDQGGMSYTSWRRNIMGEFEDPQQPDLVFKQKFKRFQEKWREQYGWDFFKPLTEYDEHHMQSLHIPTTNNQKEFDGQVLSLTKILIDSLNEKEFIKDVIVEKKSPKGLDKFEAFLLSKGLNIPEINTFLRMLQGLRSSSVAHRKSTTSKSYKKVKEYFQIGELGLSLVFTNILISAIRTLASLEYYLIRDELETDNETS